MALTIPTSVVVLIAAMLIVSSATPPPWFHETPSSPETAATTPKSDTTTVSPDTERNPTSVPDSLQDFLAEHHELAQKTRLLVAFHVQLGNSLLLEANSNTELTNFSQLKSGHYARGVPSFEALSGTFTAPWKGVYSFTVLVDFATNYTHFNSVSSVSVAICIQRDCTGKAALQSKAAVISQRFGVVVTGSLEIEKNEIVSVVIQNPSRRALTIDQSSSFMGYFLGA